MPTESTVKSLEYAKKEARVESILVRGSVGLVAPSNSKWGQELA